MDGMLVELLPSLDKANQVGYTNTYATAKRSLAL
jgi:hypothetical protein